METTYIKEVGTEQTGGNIMVDFITLHNMPFVIGVTSDSIVLYKNKDNFCGDESGELGHINIPYEDEVEEPAEEYKTVRIIISESQQLIAFVSIPKDMRLDELRDKIDEADINWDAFYKDSDRDMHTTIHVMKTPAKITLNTFYDRYFPELADNDVTIEEPASKYNTMVKQAEPAYKEVDLRDYHYFASNGTKCKTDEQAKAIIDMLNKHDKTHKYIALQHNTGIYHIYSRRIEPDMVLVVEEERSKYTPTHNSLKTITECKNKVKRSDLLGNGFSFNIFRDPHYERVLQITGTIKENGNRGFYVEVEYRVYNNGQMVTLTPSLEKAISIYNKI